MKIVAIGGGEPFQYWKNPSLIFEEIIALSGNNKPRVLIVPTASGDSAVYTKNLTGFFSETLRCRTRVLRLIGKKWKTEELLDIALDTDIVFVGSGNTLLMLSVWGKCGFDKVLSKATKNGIVMSGVSAGAICWASFGLSDSLRNETNRKSLVLLKGLGLLPHVICPHYGSEKLRKAVLNHVIVLRGGTGIGLDDGAAIAFNDGKYKVFQADNHCKAYLVQSVRGHPHERQLKLTNRYVPLEKL